MQPVVQFRRQNRDVIISNPIQEHRFIQLHLNRTESLPSSIQEDSLDLTFCSSRIEFHCDLILVGTIVPSDLSLKLFIRQGDHHTIDGKSQGRTNHSKLTIVSLDLQHQSQIVTLDDFSGDQQIQFIRNLTEVLDILYVLQISPRQTLRGNRVQRQHICQLLILHSGQSVDDPSCGMATRHIRRCHTQMLRCLDQVLLCDERFILNPEVLFCFHLRISQDLQVVQSDNRHRFSTVASSLRILQDILMNRAIQRHTVQFRGQFQLQFRSQLHSQLVVESLEETLHRISFLHSIRNLILGFHNVSLVHVIVELRILDSSLLQELITLRDNPDRLIVPIVRQILRQDAIIGNIGKDLIVLRAILIHGLTEYDDLPDVAIHCGVLLVIEIDLHILGDHLLVQHIGKLIELPSFHDGRSISEHLLELIQIEPLCGIDLKLCVLIRFHGRNELLCLLLAVHTLSKSLDILLRLLVLRIPALFSLLMLALLFLGLILCRVDVVHHGQESSLLLLLDLSNLLPDLVLFLTHDLYLLDLV